MPKKAKSVTSTDQSSGQPPAVDAAKKRSSGGLGKLFNRKRSASVEQTPLLAKTAASTGSSSAVDDKTQMSVAPPTTPTTADGKPPKPPTPTSKEKPKSAEKKEKGKSKVKARSKSVEKREKPPVDDDATETRSGDRDRQEQEMRRKKAAERQRAQNRLRQANALTKEQKTALRDVVKSLGYESQRLGVMARLIEKTYIDPWHKDIYEPEEICGDAARQVQLLTLGTFSGEEAQDECAKRQRANQKKDELANTTPMHMAVLSKVRAIVKSLNTIATKLNSGMKFVNKLKLVDLALFARELRGADEFYKEIVSLLKAIWQVTETAIEFQLHGYCRVDSVRSAMVEEQKVDPENQGEVDTERKAEMESTDPTIYVPPDAHERCGELGEKAPKLRRSEAIFSCARLLFILARTNHSTALCRALASRTTAILLVAVENEMRDEKGRAFQVASKMDLWSMLNESVKALPVAQSLASVNEITEDDEQLALSYAVLFPPPEDGREVRPSAEQTDKALAAANRAADSRRSRKAASSFDVK